MDNKLRKIFIKEYNLPISVAESPYFEESLELFEKDFMAKTKYDRFVSMIEDRFHGNDNAFMEYRNTLLNKMIESIESSEDYQEFNKGKFPYSDEKHIVGNVEIYTKEQSDNLFISYDMNKANFQALKYVNANIVNNSKSYDEFISQFTDIECFKEQDYFRQIAFGKLNPKRIISVQKHICNNFARRLEDFFGGKFSVFSIKNDEVILKYNGNSESVFNDTQLTNEHDYDGVTFKVNKFKLEHIDFKRANTGKVVTAFIKRYPNGNKTYHSIPLNYFKQVYKLINGIPLCENDMVFYYEHDLVKFINPLERI